MNHKLLPIVLLMLPIVAHFVSADDIAKRRSIIFLTAQAADTTLQASREAELKADGMTSRRQTALLYSCIMPGSGQTMLGENYKGIAFTLTSFGSLLTTIISHNNFVARGERLDALEFQYKNATTWEIAEFYYGEMKYTHDQLQSDRTRRDLFIVVTAILWTLNIVDVLYNTDDHGESLFSLKSSSERAKTRASFDSPHKPVLSLSLPLK